MPDLLLPPPDQFLREDAIRGGMDLLFFANTRFLKGADDRLAEIGLGRAHHRVLYFVGRRPDVTVSELLAILGVTKQSFGRISKDLIARGMVEQRPGHMDRRQRLLRLTESGVELERSLFAEMHANMASAYGASGGVAVASYWTVMQHLIGADGRLQFNGVHRTN